MIKTETVIINDRTLIHTYSDANRYVVREGISYDDAYDPVEFGRLYTEGDEKPPIEPEEPSPSEILSILLGDEDND